MEVLLAVPAVAEVQAAEVAAQKMLLILQEISSVILISHCESACTPTLISRGGGSPKKSSTRPTLRDTSAEASA